MAQLSEHLDFFKLGGSKWQATWDAARVVIWPIPYERTTSFIKGTAKGPEAILSASHQVELYDEELDWTPAEVGIGALDPFDDRSLSEEEAVRELELKCTEWLQAGKFVVGVGGEHTVSVALVRAHARRFPGLWVVQIDAHSDFRDTYEGSPLSHACVMARVSEVAPFVGIGIRSTDGSERQRLQPPSRFFYAEELRNDTAWMERAVAAIRDHRVYVTIDLDGFDPSEVPSVGTPEPGGLRWQEVVGFLRLLARRREIVGFDVVELCPQPGQHHSEVLAARLIYKFLGYIFGPPKTA